MQRMPIPDIATLRTLCHSGKLSRDRRIWYAWSRHLSIHLTRLLLHLPLQANHVTITSVALAVAGVALLAIAPPALAWWGALALLAHHFLDKVDGDIARFRGTFSLRGVYLDDVGHAIAGGGIFVALGLHLARQAQDAPAALALLGAGALGGLAIVIGTQSKNAGFLLYSRSVLAQPELLPSRLPLSALSALSRQATHLDREQRDDRAARPTIIGRLRDAVLVASDYTLLLPLATAGLIAESIGYGARFLEYLLYAASALQLAVLAGLIVINYTVNVEAECLRLDELARRRGDERHEE